jgi:hypothetical protein
MASRQLRRSAAGKARVAVAGLVLLLVWPPVHHALVERYRIDPWKYFGFAMYCRPTLPIRLEARALGTDARAKVDPRELPPEAQREWVAFLRERATFGQLRTPRTLADRIFRLRPGTNEVVLVVTHARLEPGSGRIVADPTEYRYARPVEPAP